MQAEREGAAQQQSAQIASPPACWAERSGGRGRVAAALRARPGAPQWSPTLPGVFSTSSFDGKLAVHNLLACTGGGVVETINADFSTTKVASGTLLSIRAPWDSAPSSLSLALCGPGGC
jgi:hypothetical protein